MKQNATLLMLLTTFFSWSLLDTMNFSGRFLFTINEHPFTTKDLFYSIVFCICVIVFYTCALQIVHG